MIQSVPDRIRQKVFHRDGERCWLCEEALLKGLQIAHQIGAADLDAFKSFKANGTLPTTISDPSHADNLFPLCPTCHSAYDTAFPSWILIPDASTLQTYIEHEKKDYDLRRNLSQSAATLRSESLLRTLPVIDRTKIRYHPAIISSQLSLKRFDVTKWPKVWLGEPTTVIHRVARRGLLESSPLQTIVSGQGKWQRGVPAIFQILIGELIRLWARPTPAKKVETASSHGDPHGKQ